MKGVLGPKNEWQNGRENPAIYMLNNNSKPSKKQGGSKGATVVVFEAGLQKKTDTQNKIGKESCNGCWGTLAQPKNYG